MFDKVCGFVWTGSDLNQHCSRRYTVARLKYLDLAIFPILKGVKWVITEFWHLSPFKSSPFSLLVCFGCVLNAQTHGEPVALAAVFKWVSKKAKKEIEVSFLNLKPFCYSSGITAPTDLKLVPYKTANLPLWNIFYEAQRITHCCGI